MTLTQNRWVFFPKQSEIPKLVLVMVDSFDFSNQLLCIFSIDRSRHKMKTTTFGVFAVKYYHKVFLVHLFSQSLSFLKAYCKLEQVVVGLSFFPTSVFEVCLLSLSQHNRFWLFQVFGMILSPAFLENWTSESRFGFHSKHLHRLNSLFLFPTEL